MSTTLHLAEELIRRPSVTPQDFGCQELLIQRLNSLGFTCETICSGPDDFRVTNLWAIKPGSLGDQAKVLMFAGHTDVVPPGPLAQWQSDPFTPTHRDGKLFGRGAADMKTSIAAFIVAVEEFCAAYPEHKESIALLITSDEEGPSCDGTIKVCELLKNRGQRLDYCIVGEPTSSKQLGDTIKNGRRGSLSGKLIVHGIQGHIAYPHLARNPIHLLAPALNELTQIEWDQGNQYFPPSTWQVSNIHAGTGANNVIPADITVDFNFRFASSSTAEELKQRVHTVLDKHQLTYTLKWHLSGEPFLTEPGALSTAIIDAIQAECGITAECSTTGGTSDGRFIAKICPQVIEFGPPNASIHQINEHIEVALIEPLKNIYRRVLETLIP